MRYFGSKVSTVEQVFKLVATRVPEGSFCDPFGGIGTVGSYFKSRNFNVWTGDNLINAYCFQVARVKLNRVPSFRKLKESLDLKKSQQIGELLNGEPPVTGWLAREYSIRRKYFTLGNARKIDACRLRINEWVRHKLVTPDEKALLLASLVNSMDRVANTAGTYYAYLKSWHRKALKPFRFELIPITRGAKKCGCFLTEAEDLVSMRSYDVLYLDPPFNERSFCSYYHLPESIASCKEPDVHGKSGIPLKQRSNSDFNRPALAAAALEIVLKHARFKLLVFHYSERGLIPVSEIQHILRCMGKTKEFRIQSKGYTTSHSSRTVEQVLYLVQHG